MKCQSTLQSEHSSESGTESDDEGLITFKSQLIVPKRKVNLKRHQGLQVTPLLQNILVHSPHLLLGKHHLNKLQSHISNNSKVILTHSASPIRMHLPLTLQVTNIPPISILKPPSSNLGPKLSHTTQNQKVFKHLFAPKICPSIRLDPSHLFLHLSLPCCQHLSLMRLKKER